MDNTFQHFGVKGMKWGVRKAVESRKEELKKQRKIVDKLGNQTIMNPTRLGASDYKILKRATRPASVKIGSAITGIALRSALSDIMGGGESSWTKMSKGETLSEVTKIMTKTVTNEVADQLAAKSISKRYDKNGKLIKGSEVNKDAGKYFCSFWCAWNEMGG